MLPLFSPARGGVGNNFVIARDSIPQQSGVHIEAFRGSID